MKVKELIDAIIIDGNIPRVPVEKIKQMQKVVDNAIKLLEKEILRVEGTLEEEDTQQFLELTRNQYSIAAIENYYECLNK